MSIRDARDLAAECRLRQLHGEASIDDLEPLFAAAIRRALHIRDQQQCSFPGCTHRFFLDAHHIEHWIDGGKTALHNLILLCRRHHTWVHEHGYRIEIDETRRPIFVSRKGHAIPRVPVSPDAPSEPIEELAELCAAAGIELDSISLMPQHWNGDPVDHHEVAHALAVETFGLPPPSIQPNAFSVSEVDGSGAPLMQHRDDWDDWDCEA